jgi:hypothetical protein
MRPANLHLLAICGVFSIASSSVAGQVDIRECPLDTTVFVDPWAGGKFVVSRVGTDHHYLCDEGVEWPHDSCRGPFGDLVLEGELFGDEEGAIGERMYATYSVIAGAPCCDWYVTSPAEMKFSATFSWLEPGDVPLLRSQPFLAIESVNFGSDFGNPLYAASCTLR